MFGVRAAKIACIISLGVMALAGAAFSQTNVATETRSGIDLTEIIVAVINLALPAVAAIATYLINAHFKNKQLADQLSNAVQNGLGIVQQKAVGRIADMKLSVSTGKPEIDAGVRYVLENANEAIKHFNIPNERIAQKIEAKLGLAEIATNLAATASPAPIIAGPLAPAPTGQVAAVRST